ncbi:AGE family epimerase/isomerase [Pseudozobellia thermophila]|uniref:Mannobiose 2-epimerase n=1 Tax=Pseudozobellia thermophila TaxID=192903 RepID=A0A1M6BAB5_9FLAO|nr:AGE family epimerase/isomerase [Pseudozobellia thermophila]SHI45669.1 mannobiose 2-epimerase [Pseudozobellia thermophila]
MNPLRQPRPFFGVLGLVGLFLVLSCQEDRTASDSHKNALQGEIETELNHLVKVWYPKTIDTVNGGFWSDFNHRWEKDGEQKKFLVSQARHVWTTATLAQFFHDDSYTEMAAHGYRFLRDRMWDKEQGGFHSLLALEGDSLTVVSKGKSAYGNSFALYGLAAYYKVSKDSSALDLAKKTFAWLEEHAHDSVYGGYFDVLQRDGSWMLDLDENDKGYDNFIRKDWKDQNSSIHLLESFTALYEVWPDALLHKRLEELLVLIRDTIATDKGYLTLHLERDWTPVSFRDSSDTYRKKHFYLDHVSFGHDVETAFLMLEASHRLGITNDSLTARKAQQMVDHALEWGWDEKNGGFYDGGYYRAGGKRSIENRAKVWWTQAEGLNSLLLMAERHPREKPYYALFEKQWTYIRTKLIDHDYGGWYPEGLDTDPSAKTKAKAQIWKANYHNIRSLINVIKMLNGTFDLNEDEG